MENVINRETVAKEYADGKSVVAKEWLNKAESRKLQKFLSGYATIEAGEVKINMSSIGDMLDYYDILVELFVVSIDGNTNVMEAFNNLKDSDAEAVQNIVMEIYNSTEKKTKSTPTNTGTTSTPEPESSMTDSSR